VKSLDFNFAVFPLLFMMPPLFVGGDIPSSAQCQAGATASSIMVNKRTKPVIAVRLEIITLARWSLYAQTNGKMCTSGSINLHVLVKQEQSTKAEQVYAPRSWNLTGTIVMYANNKAAG